MTGPALGWPVSARPTSPAPRPLGELTHAAAPPPPDAVAWGTLFDGEALSADDTAALNHCARPRAVEAGDWVFGRNELAHSLVLVRQGDIALGCRQEDQPLQPDRWVRGPGWCDLASAWLNGTHGLDAQARTAAWLLELDLPALREAVARRPSLAQRMIHALAREVRTLSTQTQDLRHKDAPARLAAWLVQQADAAGATGGGRTIHLQERKRDIAAQLGITPETLSRLMRSFSRQGVISVAGYHVTVIDPAALLRAAQ